MGTPNNSLTEIGICNLALQRIGAIAGIQTLDTTADNSTETAACAIWYPQDRDATLIDWPWPWTRGNVQLAQVSTQVPATPEWKYSYRYPTDCLACWRVVPTPTFEPTVGVIPQTTGLATTLNTGGDHWWKRPEGDHSPWSFAIEQDAAGRLIVTDLVNAWLLYTRSVSDPSQFAPDFADLLAWRLATDLAMALGISPARTENAQKGYARALGQARARFANEQQTGVAKVGPMSSLTRSRWGER